MATVELIRDDASGPALPVAATSEPPLDVPGRSSRAAAQLAGALLLLILYAAFAHGDVGLPTEGRVQVAIAILAAVAAAAWLWIGSLRFSAPRLALLGVALLGAFAVWTGVTVLWSIAPDRTWLELNRAVAYLIVLALSIALGASDPRSVTLIAKGFLAVALIVTVYALGQKLVPGLHANGIFDLNQFGPRLRAPLDYWNALALFIAFAVPIALALAADRSRSERSRLGALLGAELMLLGIGLTYSRGGLIALALAVAVGASIGGARLRSLALIAGACVATVPPLVFGLTSHALTSTGVSLARRETAGAELAGLLLVSLVVLWAVGRRLMRLESRLAPSAARSRRIGRVLGALVAVALAGAVLGLALSPRGLDGSISHAWKGFTNSRGANLYDPHRLTSVDSGNRWVWWKEAVGAFSDRPIAGWGAGSFPVLHLLYRRDTLPVQQPHSVPLQFLAETGLIGALLGIGAYVLLLAAAVATVRRTPPGTERMLAAALLAGAVAYAVHAMYDWDWDFPSVTLPALVFLGVLAGARRGGARAPVSPPGSQTPPAHAVLSPPGPGLVARALSLAGLSLVLAIFAFSAVLPSLAQTKAAEALVEASSPSAEALRGALAKANLAARLDPLSDEGLNVAATVALHQGQLTSARGYLVDAVRRVPADPLAWAGLAQVALQMGDQRALLRASRRALALDPRGQQTRALVEATNVVSVPPAQSATATATPLPAG